MIDIYSFTHLHKFAGGVRVACTCGVEENLESRALNKAI